MLAFDFGSTGARAAYTVMINGVWDGKPPVTIVMGHIEARETVTPSPMFPSTLAFCKSDDATERVRAIGFDEHLQPDARTSRDIKLWVLGMKEDISAIAKEFQVTLLQCLIAWISAVWAKVAESIDTNKISRVQLPVPACLAWDDEGLAMQAQLIQALASSSGLDDRVICCDLEPNAAVAYYRQKFKTGYVWRSDFHIDADANVTLDRIRRRWRKQRSKTRPGAAFLVLC